MESPEQPQVAETPKQRHYLAIREKTREVKILHSQWAASKEDTKICRAKKDKAHAELIELISRGPDPQPLFPAFYGEGEESAESDGTPPVDATPTWRDRPISDLGLSDALNEKLIDAGLDTLGKLQHFWTVARKSLCDVKGIGDERSADVADAWMDFVKVHPEVFPELASAEAEANEAATTETPPSGDVNGPPDPGPTIGDVVAASLEWRVVSVRELPLSIPRVNDLLAIPLETLGALHDFWVADKSLLMEGVKSSSNQAIIAAWSEYCDSHIGVPRFEDDNPDPRNAA